MADLCSTDARACLLAFALASLPNSSGRFLVLGLASTSLIYELASRYSPAGRMKVLESLIASADAILVHAQSICVVDQYSLLDEKRRLRGLQKQASKLKCDALEGTGSPWKSYLPAQYRLWRNITERMREAEDIQMSIQVRTGNTREKKMLTQPTSSCVHRPCFSHPMQVGIRGSQGCAGLTRFVIGTQNPSSPLNSL
ncbi:hypothetical protein C8F01DRAFT_1184346 [Mycena amicta]|nr:hypothetical protein C8F01DRAFT_1184346 [Mycena amicta]